MHWVFGIVESMFKGSARRCVAPSEPAPASGQRLGLALATAVCLCVSLSGCSPMATPNTAIRPADQANRIYAEHQKDEIISLLTDPATPLTSVLEVTVDLGNGTYSPGFITDIIAWDQTHTRTTSVAQDAVEQALTDNSITEVTDLRDKATEAMVETWVNAYINTGHVSQEYIEVA